MDFFFGKKFVTYEKRFLNKSWVDFSIEANSATFQNLIFCVDFRAHCVFWLI